MTMSFEAGGRRPARFETQACPARAETGPPVWLAPPRAISERIEPVQFNAFGYCSILQ